MFLSFNFVFFTHIIFSWCQEWDFGKLEIVTDLVPEMCFIQNLNYVEADEYGIPKCSFYNETSIDVCTIYRDPDLYPVLVNRPTCGKNGRFAPKQCKGNPVTGRCYCFNERGDRIFGQDWAIQADSMTCACSRKKADMLATAPAPQSPDYLVFNSLHCDSRGNYEPLQCDVISRQCWCADPQTGDLTSPVVPEKAKTLLPCFYDAKVGTQYLRKCENQKYAHLVIEHQFMLRGTKLYNEHFLCDDDGSYGAYAVTNGIAYCTWRDNSRIGSWQAFNRTNMNCNCARDKNIFARDHHAHNQQCDSNGNYAEFQIIGSTQYCVDLDGHVKSVGSEQVVDAGQCAIYQSYH